ncbi:MAG: SLC13 family permease [Verrucomicrobia bacterium]|nr:SLC13 family permease [Verrucomicrobiota bacterium]
MTLDIVLVFAILALALASFIWEKIPVEVTAISVFALILALGLLPVNSALTVLSNPAPVTVGAMFMVSAGLEKCGAIEIMTGYFKKLASAGYVPFLFVMILSVAFISAFINNTPVVVIFMPVLLSLAKQMDVPASKLLIPLSYASIFGGVCTLMGTSTNILVSGIAESYDLAPFSMFELGKVGLPLLVLGTIYLMVFSKKRLPIRETLTQILSPEERREFITEAFIRHDSPMAGKSLIQSGILKTAGVRILEIVRGSVAIPDKLDEITLQEGDRLVLACKPHGIAQARNFEGIDFLGEIGEGLEQIAASEGSIVEGFIGPNSSIVGKTVGQIDFRQRFRMIILALHRRGKNVREKLETLPLEFGDTLLMMGTDQAIASLRNSNDINLLDKPHVPSRSRRKKIPIVIATILGIVGFTTFTNFPIVASAIVGVSVLLVTQCISSKEAFDSVSWNIIFLIYGMLALGLAMQETGASSLIANNAVAGVNYLVSPEWQPYVMLAVMYLMCSFLTEILSNNATAALLAPVGISIAVTMGVDPRSFLVVTAIASSASFATPIGYQTNTFVYGVGGYRFSDFLKFGLPLNLLYFGVSVFLVPMIWPF